MTDQHEDWQERLKKGPFTEEPFTEDHKQRVIQTVQNLTPHHSQHKPRPWQWKRMLLTVGISGAVLASIWWLVPNRAMNENIASLSDEAAETSHTEFMSAEIDSSPNQKNNDNPSPGRNSPTSTQEQSTQQGEAAAEAEDSSVSTSENVEEELTTQQDSATDTSGSSLSLAASYPSFETLLADSELAAEIEVLNTQSDPYIIEIKDILYSTTGVTPGEKIDLNYAGVTQRNENTHAEDSYNPPLSSGDHAIMFLKKSGDSDSYHIAGVYQGNYMIQQGKVSSVGERPSAEELELVRKDSGTSRFVMDMELTKFKEMLRTIAKK
ncbi:hypothetical protein PUW24_09230 [Paenibacillus urinalis]|uniref:DUF4367 domain-containing protein n=1 Tax=Paenibacillus urinalis TaxID=521520 RepID=A0ABY7XDS2_9BACL|nr:MULTISPECIES: hypothetical protein [Paenibacillus]WDH99034.1 hypothetical protein PUW24_09230 [Paenibacillus urinalis]WDI02727.1 hypothetical protein PUW25_01680 [Paenibacillus urinalis]GAK40210.1 hypothetical protein TCA2_2700 [Paenibacillus sp. TCA20]